MTSRTGVLTEFTLRMLIRSCIVGVDEVEEAHNGKEPSKYFRNSEFCHALFRQNQKYFDNSAVQHYLPINWLSELIRVLKIMDSLVKPNEA